MIVQILERGGERNGERKTDDDDHQRSSKNGYPAGTWGPDISDRIIDGGKKWSNPCKNLTDTDKYCEL